MCAITFSSQVKGFVTFLLCVLVSIISYDILGSSLAFGFGEAAVKSE